MSQNDLWSALGRSRIDPEFSRRLMIDPDRAIQEAGYKLSAPELEQMRQAFIPPGAPGPASPEMAADMEYQRKKTRERLDAQTDRSNDLGRYTVTILKDTLNNARSAYHRITLMNGIMFFTGIGLFLFAAAYGAISKDTSYTLVLAGLGVANFVALFILGPVERTQSALSNLVQVEVMFMNYFEQITFWETYAFAPRGNPPAPDPAFIKEASEQLQRRTEETVAHLQHYIETEPAPSAPDKARVRADSAELG